MQRMKPMHWVEIMTALVLLVPCLAGLSNPSSIDEPTAGITLPSMVPLHTAGISARITWPHIGNPAIILNGSELEIHVQAPNNISSWEIAIYREYRQYSLSHGVPLFNATRGQYEINVTIPANAARDLYDLRVTLSDGLNGQSLEEWNAIQVRQAYPANFTIMHITDTHFFGFPSAYSTQLLSALCEAAMLNADLIFVTGDLTDDGNGASFTFLKEILRQSRVPTFVCPGNHDRDSFGQMSTYSAAFGPDYYTASLGPDVFIVVVNSHGYFVLNWTQIAWIEADMAASSARFKVLAMHHPLYNVRDPRSFFLGDAEAEALLNITATYSVDLVLTGHEHNDRVDYVNGTRWIMTTSLGGSVWKLPTDPGHHQNGLRVIIVENYTAVSWGGAYSGNWSQPWNKVVVERDPGYFRDVDQGGYLRIVNNLTEPLDSQTVDFLVRPLQGGAVYRVSGASVVETVNGTDAWLVRLEVTIGVGGTATLRIFTSNAVAPTINAVSYPNPGLTGVVIAIYVNVTNPLSGVHIVLLNVSIDGGAFGQARLGSIGGSLYRYTQFFVNPATVAFRAIAADYSGLNSTTSLFNFVVTNRPVEPTLADPGQTSSTGLFTLTWSGSFDPDGTVDHYELQMSNDSSFVTVLDEWTPTANNQDIFGLVNGTYFFRVRAVDNVGAASYWSNIESITVAIPASSTPPPPSPNWLLVVGVACAAIVVVTVVAVYFMRVRRPKKR